MPQPYEQTTLDLIDLLYHVLAKHLILLELFNHGSVHPTKNEFCDDSNDTLNSELLACVLVSIFSTETLKSKWT